MCSTQQMSLLSCSFWSLLCYFWIVLHINWHTLIGYTCNLDYRSLIIIFIVRKLFETKHTREYFIPLDRLSTYTSSWCRTSMFNSPHFNFIYNSRKTSAHIRQWWYTGTTKFSTIKHACYFFLYFTHQLLPGFTLSIILTTKKITLCTVFKRWLGNH